MQGDIGHGIHRVPSLGFSNAYLLEVDSNSLILIDTGTSSGGPKILAYLGKLGKNSTAVSHVILTHADGDHSGSAAMLKRSTGAKLGIHELDAPRISGEKKLKEASGAGGALLGLFTGLMKVERVKPDILLKDGDTIGPLSVVHTPGHTDGSICLYRPNEALFVGDTIRVSGSGGLRLPAGYMSRDMSELRKSVEKISKLEFSALLPGHGEPIVENASQKVGQFVANGFQ